jgi:hypothetical protein
MMARRVVVQTRTELDDVDRERIAQVIGTAVCAICAESMRAIEQGVWDDLTISLADAGDWGMILADVMRKDLSSVEDIRARVARLDTAARDVWWTVLDEIESRIQD